MQRLLIVFFLFIVFQSSAQEKFQLAPPMLKYNSGFFSDTATFIITFNQPGVKVYYTLNGNEPTQNDFAYTQPVIIKKKTTVKVKAIGDDYLPSETITAEFIKTGKIVSDIKYSTPNETYAKAKPDILNDNIGGLFTYRNGTWLGYNSDTVNIEITMPKKEKISSVLIDLLQDQNSWIFLPLKIELFYYDIKKQQFVLSTAQSFASDTANTIRKCVPQQIKPGKKIKTDKLKLVLYAVKKIPDWHPGKGYNGWLFIDEIKVY